MPSPANLIPVAASWSRRLLGRLAAAVAVVVLVGCSTSTETSTPTTSARRTTTTSPELTTSEVENLLLAVDDLPPNWSPGGAGDDSSDAAEPGEPAGGSEDAEADLFCPAAAEPLRNEAHQAAEVSFSRSSMGPEFAQSLLSAPDPAAHFEDVQRVFDSCLGQPWTMDADGETMTMSMSTTSPPDLGDAAVSYRVNGTGSQGTTVAMDIDVVRRGSVVQAYFGVSFAAPGVDVEQFGPDEFNQMVATGDAKVADGLSGTA
ncbi:MAG: hypothetical protein ACKO04_13785 [Actinomycetes bacterium]